MFTHTSVAYDEATSYGIELARATLDPAALDAMATYGYKGVTGYEGSNLDEVCRNSAQDEAKSLVAAL